MTREDNEIWRVLGSLQTAVENLTSQWSVQDERATAGRDKMHSALNGLRNDVTSLQGDVVAVTRKVDTLAPTVKAGEAAQLQNVGVRKLLGLLWQVAYALICALGGVAVMRWHGGSAP